MKISPNYSVIINLDAQLLLIEPMQQMRSIESIEGVAGDKTILTDFEGSMPYAMMINAPSKYVSHVLEKKLEDDGLIDGAAKVLVHYKKAYGSGLTHTFFTAVPADIYAKHMQGAEKDRDLQLTFSFNAALHAQIRQMQTSKPIACLFVHGRHIDLVVADSAQVYAATRLSVFGGEENHSLICDNTSHALGQIEKTEKITIDQVYINYFQSEKNGSIAERLESLFNAPCHDFAEQHYELNGQAYTSSHMSMLDALKSKDTHSELAALMHHTAWKSVPIVAMILFGLMLGLLGTSYVWRGETTTLQANSANIQHTLQQSVLSSIAKEREKDKALFHQTLALANSMNRAQSMPSIQEVLSDLSYALSAKFSIEHIALKYDKNSVHLALSGQMNTSFSDGMKAYNHLIHAMKKKGYVLIEKQMHVDISVNHFTLTMERRFVNQKA